MPVHLRNNFCYVLPEGKRIRGPKNGITWPTVYKKPGNPFLRK